MEKCLKDGSAFIVHLKDIAYSSRSAYFYVVDEVSPYDRDRFGASFQMKSSYMRKEQSYHSLPILASAQDIGAYCEATKLPLPEFWTHSLEAEEEAFDAAEILQHLLTGSSEAVVTPISQDNHPTSSNETVSSSDVVAPIMLFDTPPSLSSKVKMERDCTPVQAKKLKTK